MNNFPVAFTLTDVVFPTCHGTSFPSFETAKFYAKKIQEFGMCKIFSIGCYKNGKHVEVYRSDNLHHVILDIVKSSKKPLKLRQIEAHVVLEGIETSTYNVQKAIAYLCDCGDLIFIEDNFCYIFGEKQTTKSD